MAIPDLDTRYHLLNAIGAGATGTVYRAMDRELDREVAVKVLRTPPSDWERRATEQRFAREAEVLARLRHPNIVTIHDRCVTADGEAYLVMELLDGVPLSDVIGRLRELREDHSWAELADTGWMHELSIAVGERSYVRLAVQWVADLAQALHAAHEAMVFHRDVKPSNIHVDRAGRVRLLDFGAAARAADATITLSGQAVGTPAYMAPELAHGRVRTDARLDVYSLTATLYHLLAAEPPYSGDTAGVLVALQRRQAPSLHRLHALPGDLRAIVERGMAQDPRDRYATAADLEADLRAFLEHRPVKARHRGRLARVVVRARRSRPVQLGVVAALIAVAGIAYHDRSRSRLLERQRQHLAIMAELPPLLSVHRNTSADHPALATDLLDRLDRAVELRPADVPTRVTRMLWRIDLADPEGAARDAVVIAGALDTPFARALARTATSFGSDGLPRLGALPAAEHPADRFVAAHLAVREDRIEAALSLLAPAAGGEARQLALVVRATGDEQSDRLPETRTAMRRLYEDAIALEGTLGTTTTRTRFAVATALRRQFDLRNAVVVYRSLLERNALAELAWRDLGLCLAALDDMPEAEKAFQRALQLDHGSVDIAMSCLRFYVLGQRFDSAAKVAKSLDERFHALAAFVIHAGRALQAMATGERRKGLRAARRALSHWDRRTTGGPATATRRDHRLVRSFRVVLAGKETAFDHFLGLLLAGDPGDPELISLMVGCMPLDVTEAQTRRFARFLDLLSEHPGLPDQDRLGPAAQAVLDFDRQR